MLHPLSVNQVVLQSPATDYNYLAVGESVNVVIDYTISDGNGGTDSAQLTVTVTGTNDGPVAVNNSGTTDEGQLAVV